MSLSVLSSKPDEALGRFEEALQRAQEAAGSLRPGDVADALGEAERLKARLWARLYASTVSRPQEEDRLLEVEEAAKRLAISTDTLYRKARDLPFTVRIGGNVRFSARGLTRYIETRQGR